MATVEFFAFVAFYVLYCTILLLVASVYLK